MSAPDAASRIAIVLGDITRQETDAIVNAANESLLGGGGVDGAIHRAAGPGLLEECRRIGGCPTGETRITGGHRLAARLVIHAVGPIWHGGNAGEDDLLAGCYRGAFALAAKHGIQSIAFPAISTGAFGFPMERACRIAMTETRRFLDSYGALDRVVFCCFGKDSLDCHRRVFAEVLGRPAP